jgi:Glucose-6-phosphate dehydrogenase, C-terminal domain
LRALVVDVGGTNVKIEQASACGWEHRPWGRRVGSHERPPSGRRARAPGFRRHRRRDVEAVGALQLCFAVALWNGRDAILNFPPRTDDLDLARVRVRQPGREPGSMGQELMAVRDAGLDEVDACGRLLTDAMKGDPTLFVREDAVEEAWKVVEGVPGDAAPLHDYEPGSWAPPRPIA